MPTRSDDHHALTMREAIGHETRHIPDHVTVAVVETHGMRVRDTPVYIRNHEVGRYAQITSNNRNRTALRHSVVNCHQCNCRVRAGAHPKGRIRIVRLVLNSRGGPSASAW